MRNILFVHSSLNFSGGEKVTLMIASSLLAGGELHPVIGCHKDNAAFIDEARSLGATVITMDICNISASNPFRSIMACLEVLFTLLKSRIKLIQVVDPVAYRYISIPASILRVPSIFHYHFPYSDDALKWFFNMLPKPDIMLFCCNAIKYKMEQCLKVIAPKSKLVTIHNGINLSEFTFRENRKKTIRNIAIVGNLQERKGHLDFIDMAGKLSDIPNLTFHIIGDDVSGENRKPLLKKKCEKLKLAERVIFHGFVKDVQLILAKMDLLICASYEEAFPLNILEAMAIGIPVVATDVDGIPEAISHGIHGFLVKPGDSQSMKEYVELLIQEPEVANKIVAEARNRVSQNFSNSIFGEKFKEFYGSLVNI